MRSGSAGQRPGTNKKEKQKMKSFENTVSRYRKIDEMIEELKDYVNTLTGERDMLGAEIVSHLATHPAAYNVFKHKTSSAGIVGRNMFTVAFSEQLCRTKPNARLDDQEWLKSDVDDKYFKSKLLLLTSKVNADFKSGKLDASSLRKMGLDYRRVGNVSVSRIPNDSELDAIREEAASTADSIED